MLGQPVARVVPALGVLREIAGILEGLGGVYDQLVSDLGDDKTFGPFVRGMRDRWRKRVDAKGWPKFLSH